MNDHHSRDEQINRLKIHSTAMIMLAFISFIRCSKYDSVHVISTICIGYITNSQWPALQLA